MTNHKPKEFIAFSNSGGRLGQYDQFDYSESETVGENDDIDKFYISFFDSIADISDITTTEQENIKTEEREEGNDWKRRL